MKLQRRLERLERAAPSGCSWQPPLLENPTPEEIERVRQEARAAGWHPECGKPFVIVAKLPEEVQQ